jgi:uncharacterized protein YciI
MAGPYLVRLTCGPAWDRSRGRREQHGWDEHAAFMDGLVADGLIVLGGPVGGVEGEDTVHLMEADSEEQIRARLAQDPWAGDLLTVKSVEPWTIWLRA